VEERKMNRSYWKNHCKRCGEWLEGYVSRMRYHKSNWKKDDHPI